MRLNQFAGSADISGGQSGGSRGVLCSSKASASTRPPARLPAADQQWTTVETMKNRPKEVVVNIGEADDNIKVPNTSARSKNLSWEAQTPIG